VDTGYPDKSRGNKTSAIRISGHRLSGQIARQQNKRDPDKWTPPKTLLLRPDSNFLFLRSSNIPMHINPAKYGSHAAVTHISSRDRPSEQGDRADTHE
jgi:hypothetical protein